MGLPRDPASASVDDENDYDEPVQDLRASRRRATRIRGLAAAALVVALAWAGYEGWLLSQRQQKDVAAAQALAVAENYVVTLTSVDSNTLDKHVADVLDGSTGEFNDNYARTASGQHSRHVVNDKVKTHGKVVESAVKSATTNKVQVLLMVDQSVSSLASPEPQIDRSRIKMTMQKIDGRWLVSKVELL
ncbi:MAG: Mce protein [Mycobacterium sp.]|uniref:Mce protein n=1 Tax=Mycobacterium sp. TaxID=1785 RepID=UPI003C478D0F